VQGCKTWGIIPESNFGGISGRMIYNLGSRHWATRIIRETLENFFRHEQELIVLCWHVSLTPDISRFVKDRPSTEIYFIVEVFTFDTI